jgi:hypothetical protein
MKKVFGVALVALFLAACGGGSDGGGVSTPAAKPLTISMYGKPLVSASAATAHAQSAATSEASAATPASGSTAAQATVQTLADALAARGVTANVTAQVMDGTTLHQIVIGENNGLPPTPDQFKTDPSEWMVVNFQLDDMATGWSDPAQTAAATQFTNDLLVFSQRAAVAGKAVFVVMPIRTCDMKDSAVDALSYAINQAFLNGAPLRFVGATGVSFSFDSAGKLIDNPMTVHMGADCRTPDAYLQNLQMQSIADTIAEGYKEAASPASAASGASATGT